MFKDRLPASRFFARIIDLDIECPRCGTVIAGRARGGRGGWDRTTQRFECTACKLILGLGVLAWPLSIAPSGDRGAGDARPNYRQALALRAQAGGFLVEEKKRQAASKDRNVVLVQGCTCTEIGVPGVPGVLGVLGVHPGCPVHGHGEKV